MDTLRPFSSIHSSLKPLPEVASIRIAGGGSDLWFQKHVVSAQFPSPLTGQSNQSMAVLMLVAISTRHRSHADFTAQRLQLPRNRLLPRAVVESDGTVPNAP